MTKQRLDSVMIIVACVAVASWFLGFSLQGKPNHDLLKTLAGVGFFGAIFAGLIAGFSHLSGQIDRQRRSGAQPDDDKKPN